MVSTFHCHRQRCESEGKVQKYSLQTYRRVTNAMSPSAVRTFVFISEPTPVKWMVEISSALHDTFH